MKDFLSTILIFVMAVLTVLLIARLIAKATVYEDNHNSQLIQTCQNSGRAYADCYDAVEYSDPFNK